MLTRFCVIIDTIKVIFPEPKVYLDLKRSKIHKSTCKFTALQCLDYVQLQANRWSLLCYIEKKKFFVC